MRDILPASILAGNVRFALPTKKQVLKGIGWLLGTIFVGALGSGVWQSLLGPALHVSTRWLLDVASLGLRSYKDGVYQQIAVDNQPRVDVATLYMVTFLYGSLTIVAFSYAFAQLQSFFQRTERMSGNTPEPAMTTPESFRQELEAVVKSLRRTRLVGYACMLLFAVFLVNQSVNMARLSYVNSADAHYHHVLRIASPYLEAHEQAQVESDFAQVSSRDDYVRLLSRLESECKAHGRTFPKFDPW